MRSEIEVIVLGKAATLVLLIALPVLTLGATDLAVADAARLLGLAGLWAGVVTVSAIRDWCDDRRLVSDGNRN